MAGEPDLRAVGAGFAIEGEWRGAGRLGHGHIHQTWVARFERGGRITRYVHQAINQEVFRDVPGLMRNIERVTTHLAARAAAAASGVRWEVPGLVRSRAGKLWWPDGAGGLWRTFAFVERARTFEVASTPMVAREAARAFGRFARDLDDFDPARLVESIPGFHDLPGRLVQLERAADDDRSGRRASARAEIEAVQARGEVACEFGELRASGALPIRVVHNDTKVNNALLDEATGRGVAVIDLDTVMPGSLLFDYGDLVRTATCGAAEDERDLSRVRVDPELFGAVTEGYLAEVAPIATAAELDHLLLGGRLMMLMVGVRFLTDYLEGDWYFRTTRPGQNLDRARVQIALLRSLESSAPSLGERIRIARDRRRPG